MRNTILFIAVMASSTIQAQIKVDGRHASLDTLTSTLLATVPERLFGTSATLGVEAEEGWHDVTIATLPPVEGTAAVDAVAVAQTAPATFYFSDINADSKYLVTAKDGSGHQRTDTLRFTFLPVIQLLGDFGYDYTAGTFLFSHPDSLCTDTIATRIKWRGGTTNADDKHKRNYKLNFDEDQRFFGLRNDDKWMLDAGQPDVFRLRNRIAMDLWNKMARKPYYADQEPKALNGVRGDVIELFLGNEWHGIYNLSEFIDRKQLKLKKVDSKTGEIRGCLYKGVSWDKTQMYNFFANYDNTKDTFFGYEFKYPELGDDSDTVDWAPLVEANNFAKNSTDEEFMEHVEDYFDIPVVIDYNIFYNVVNAVDNAGKNMYWAVYDKTQTKRLTPTPWDLDATFGQRWGGLLDKDVDEGNYTSPEFRLDFEVMLTYRMFRDNFNDYVGRMNERYRSLRQPGQPLHTDSILSIVGHYYHAVKNSGAASREEARWSGDSDVWGDAIDFDTEYAYICDWISKRMDFIDKTELPLFYKQSYFNDIDLIPQIFTASLDGRSSVYDLSGRKVETGSMKRLKPGFYICGGRKYFAK